MDGSIPVTGKYNVIGKDLRMKSICIAATVDLYRRTNGDDGASIATAGITIDRNGRCIAVGQIDQ